MGTATGSEMEPATDRTKGDEPTSTIVAGFNQREPKTPGTEGPGDGSTLKASARFVMVVGGAMTEIVKVDPKEVGPVSSKVWYSLDCAS
jgi:hypothetical protein